MLKRPKPKRAPGENPVLRRHFLHELLAHDHAGDLGAFLETLRYNTDPGYHRLPLDLPDLVIDNNRRRIARDYLRHVELTHVARIYFRAWLRVHGINPNTGEMTLDDLAFFEECTRPHPDEP